MMSIKHHQMSLVQTIYCIFATKISLIHSQSQSNQMCCSISQLWRFSSRLQVFSSIYEARFSYLSSHSIVQIFIWKRLHLHLFTWLLCKVSLTHFSQWKIITLFVCLFSLMPENTRCLLTSSGAHMKCAHCFCVVCAFENVWRTTPRNQDQGQPLGQGWSNRASGHWSSKVEDFFLALLDPCGFTMPTIPQGHAGNST